VDPFALPFDAFGSAQRPDQVRSRLARCDGLTVTSRYLSEAAQPA